MRRFFAWWLCIMLLTGSFDARAILGIVDPGEVAAAITELDVKRAGELLAAARTESAALAFQRAKLSVYLGDCDAADATLASLEPSEDVNQLASLARRCARAVAGSVVVHDEARGLWIRLQDDGDRALVPYITDVADRAREAVERDVGTRLPRPLRIDLVRDLFSLSAVSGLPLEAAETTGTVAVARWGRVTMLSPRASPHGYPWEDTFTHELMHLALSRATRDFAPLWLQEGLAKRSETRWRSPRPFDDVPSVDAIALDALVTGQSVGVDALGPSIAMLPSARAASIAFAEVESFVRFLIDTAGQPALALLLADLKGLESRDADRALRSVTGYDLSEWILRWQQALRERPQEEAPDVEAVDMADVRHLARSVRVGDLLFRAGEMAAARRVSEAALQRGAQEPSVRWRAARVALASDDTEAAGEALGQLEDLESGHAGWYAASGRLFQERGDSDAARERHRLAVALNPYLEDAACAGYFRKPGEAEGPLPEAPRARALCEAARKIPRH